MEPRGEVPPTTQQGWPIPDWLSPARLIALTAPVPYPVTVPPATVTQVAKANARRVGLLVMVPDTMKAGFFLSPGSNPDVAGISLAASGNYFLATLSDWLSFTCGAWTCYSTSGGVVQVIELVRPR